MYCFGVVESKILQLCNVENLKNRKKIQITVTIYFNRILHVHNIEVTFQVPRIFGAKIAMEGDPGHLSIMLTFSPDPYIQSYLFAKVS